MFFKERYCYISVVNLGIVYFNRLIVRANNSDDPERYNDILVEVSYDKCFKTIFIICQIFRKMMYLLN